MKNLYELKKFSSGMHYIMPNVAAVEQFIKDGNNRVICILNNTFEFHCAILPKKEGGYFINIGSNICKKLNIKEGSEVVASFKPDTSEYQFEIPEEFKEVLNQDKEANRVFHSLTHGNQRGLIYLILQVKTSRKRIERAFKIAHRLKHGITSPKRILK